MELPAFEKIPLVVRAFTSGTEGHSIFWRMLRPEYVKRYQQPLSPDSDCAISSATEDGDFHVSRVIDATKHFVENELTLLAEDLASRGPLGPRSRDCTGLRSCDRSFCIGDTCKEDGFWV